MGLLYTTARKTQNKIPPTSSQRNSIKVVHRIRHWLLNPPHSLVPSARSDSALCWFSEMVTKAALARSELNHKTFPSSIDQVLLSLISWSPTTASWPAATAELQSLTRGPGSAALGSERHAIPSEWASLFGTTTLGANAPRKSKTPVIFSALARHLLY